MHWKLQEILGTLLLNIETLNDEIQRLARSEQFTSDASCVDLMEEMRGACMCSLRSIRSIERVLARRGGGNPADVISITRRGE